MTLCRSRGEPGRVGHRGATGSVRVRCSARRLLFLRRSLQKISLQAASSQRLIASLWRACLPIAFMRE